MQSQEYRLGPDVYGIDKVWPITKGSGVTVAVLDTGVQASLPELAGQVLPGTNLLTGNGGGRTDVHDDTFPASTPLGHGTDIASIIAANGQGNGYVGIAPEARILPATVLGGQTDSTYEGAAGIRWAVAHGANIINLSNGSVGPCQSDMQAAVLDAYEHNVVVVAATGNSSSSVSNPANCLGALAVGFVTSSFVPYSDETLDRNWTLLRQRQICRCRIYC